MTKALEATEGIITDPTGRLLRDAVATFVESGVKSLATQERWAKETPGMEKPATVAQEVDSVHVGVFYKMLIASMLARAVDQELAAMSAGTDGGAGDYECSCGCGCSAATAAAVAAIAQPRERSSSAPWMSCAPQSMAGPRP